MALTAQDFGVTKNKIIELNTFIEQASMDFFASDHDLDPIEFGNVTVSFDFGPPLGGR